MRRRERARTDATVQKPAAASFSGRIENCSGSMLEHCGAWMPVMEVPGKRPVRNARRVGEAVRAVSSDEGIVRIALGNYLEAVAEFAAGGRRERIYAVLSACVLGGGAG